MILLKVLVSIIPSVELLIRALLLLVNVEKLLPVFVKLASQVVIPAHLLPIPLLQVWEKVL